jgi:hypothetical protein
MRVGQVICKACPRCHSGDLISGWDTSRNGASICWQCLQCSHEIAPKSILKDTLLFKKDYNLRSNGRGVYKRRGLLVRYNNNYL